MSNYTPEKIAELRRRIEWQKDTHAIDYPIAAIGVANDSLSDALSEIERLQHTLRGMLRHGRIAEAKNEAFEEAAKIVEQHGSRLTADRIRQCITITNEPT